MRLHHPSRTDRRSTRMMSDYQIVVAALLVGMGTAPMAAQTTSAGPSNAEPTINQAHAFLGPLLIRGTTLIGRQGGVAFSWVGQGCRTTVRASEIRGPILVDWSEVSQIDDSWNYLDPIQSIRIYGKIQYSNGVYNELFVVAESEALRVRIVRAMQVLRASCDRSKAYPF